MAKYVEFKDDFLQLRLYKIKTIETRNKTEKIQKTKQLLIPLILILLTIFVVQTQSIRSKKLNNENLCEFYQHALNNNLSSVLLDSLEDFRNHFYNILTFMNRPNDSTFVKIDRQNLQLNLTWENTAHMKFYFLTVDFAQSREFDISNVADVLGLPFPLENSKEIGEYFSSILNMDLHISGLFFCLRNFDRSSSKCFESKINLKYINRHNVVVSNIDCSLTSKRLSVLGPFCPNSPEFFGNRLTTSRFNFVYSSNSQKEDPIFDIYFLLSLGLMGLGLTMLVLNVYFYYLLVTQKNLDKHFKLIKIIYEENYQIDFKHINNFQKTFSIDFLFIISVIGNLCMFGFFFTEMVFSDLEFKVLGSLTAEQDSLQAEPHFGVGVRAGSLQYQLESADDGRDLQSRLPLPVQNHFGLGGVFICVYFVRLAALSDFEIFQLALDFFHDFVRVASGRLSAQYLQEFVDLRCHFGPLCR